MALNPSRSSGRSLSRRQRRRETRTRQFVYMASILAGPLPLVLMLRALLAMSKQRGNEHILKDTTVLRRAAARKGEGKRPKMKSFSPFMHFNRTSPRSPRLSRRCAIGFKASCKLCAAGYSWGHVHCTLSTIPALKNRQLFFTRLWQ
jgi:hypothetical protein